MSIELRDAILREAAGSATEVCGLLLAARHPGLVPGSTTRLLPTQEAPAPDVRHGGPRHGGRGDVVVTAILPTRNVAADPSRLFEIDPAVLLAAHRAARNGGPQVIGHYHSHPNGRAEPSPRDAADAAPDGAVWIVVAAGRLSAWRAVPHGTLHERFAPLACHLTPHPPEGGVTA